MPCFSPFDFEVVCRPGEKHGNADGLSRQGPVCFKTGNTKCYCEKFEGLEYEPDVKLETKTYCDASVQVTPDVDKGTCRRARVIQQGKYHEEIKEEQKFSQTNVSWMNLGDLDNLRVASVVPLWSVNEMATAQFDDHDIGPVLKALKSDHERPSWNDISPLSPESKVLFSEWKRLEVKDNLLYRKWEEDNKVSWLQLVIPRKYRETVLLNAHDQVTCGHNGGFKTYERVKLRFFWPKMREHIRRWVATCNICQQRKGPNQSAKAPLQQYLVGGVGERVAMDITGPFSETDKGNRWILCIGDVFTKYCVAVPLQNITAVTVSEALLSNWICYFGLPLEIHSDKGSQFESEVFTQMCSILGIDKTRTTTMNPQSNGFIEHVFFLFFLLLLLHSYIPHWFGAWGQWVT